MGIEVLTEARVLIFDLDGTLSNSLPVHLISWNMVGKKYGFRFDPKIVQEMTGRPTSEFAQRVIEKYHLNEIPSEIVKFKQQAFWNLTHMLKPVDEVVAIVKKYHGKLPMAVGTGAGRTSAELQLKQLEIKHYFDVIVTADDVKTHKPNPHTFLECARQLGVEPQHCQVFEDGDLGITAAKNAGMMVTDIRPFIKYGEWILS